MIEEWSTSTTVVELHLFCDGSLFLENLAAKVGPVVSHCGDHKLFYNARYYDPAIGRFLSADSVVPGNASGGMGGVALRPLTVDFHEPGFVAGLNGEGANADKLRWGGPLNPQSLNRYSYVLNNPMRWTDPTGHDNPGPDKLEGGAPGTGGGGGAPAKGIWAWLKALFTGAGAAASADGDPTNEVTTFTRALTQADIGVKGSLQQLDGTFSVTGNIVTVRINMIQGRIDNPLQMLRGLVESARSAGAEKVRIEAFLANEQLNDILVRRYGMQIGAGPNGMDLIEITLK